jgi:LEA14-like dessication related protein
MKRLVSVALVLVGWAMVAAGCATILREGEVAVSLVSIRPLQSTLFESSAELTLRYTNETSSPLALAGSTHRLYINGTYVGRAVTNQGLTIPQLGTNTQTMTAHIENLALMRKAQQLGNVRAVDYRIDSRLHATDAQGGGTLAATATGQLDLSGLLPAEATPPSAQ